MDTIQDFEDMLTLLNKYGARYLIIGGLAFIYHAKPRYTKDMDLWIDAATENIEKVNQALEEFGSSYTMTANKPEEILQIGVEPDRIDIHQSIPGVTFAEAWDKRIIDSYGAVKTNWLDLDNLILVKKQIDHPRHREDVRILLEVKKLNERRKKKK